MKSTTSVCVCLVVAAVSAWCQPAPASSSLRALFAATQTGSVSRVQQMISAGADVNGRTTEGLTPLMLAVDKGHREIVQLLLANGADVNARIAFYGISALTLAMRRRTTEPEIVALLLRAGARKDLSDKRDRVPLILTKLR
jgi:ankyrin repeat protein